MCYFNSFKSNKTHIDLPDGPYVVGIAMHTEDRVWRTPKEKRINIYTKVYPTFDYISRTIEILDAQQLTDDRKSRGTSISTLVLTIFELLEVLVLFSLLN